MLKKLFILFFLSPLSTFASDEVEVFWGVNHATCRTYGDKVGDCNYQTPVKEPTTIAFDSENVGGSKQFLYEFYNSCDVKFTYNLRIRKLDEGYRVSLFAGVNSKNAAKMIVRVDRLSDLKNIRYEGERFKSLTRRYVCIPLMAFSGE